MRYRPLMFMLVFLFIGAVSSAATAEKDAQPAPPAENEDSTFRFHTVTTSEGLHFRVPEDMPIETRNGTVGPIPFDEYMYGKFKQMDEHLKSIDKKLEDIQKSLNALRGEKSKVLGA